MTRSRVYGLLLERMAHLARPPGLRNEEVEVHADVLTPEQAIGRPRRRVNGTIDFCLEVCKQLVFYGNTIAGAAALSGLQTYCPGSLPR